LAAPNAYGIPSERHECPRTQSRDPGFGPLPNIGAVAGSLIAVNFGRFDNPHPAEPEGGFVMGWNIEVIAAKPTGLRDGNIRRCESGSNRDAARF
jgi:hypothetical protein